jgi:hypothetical protein|tara:strand:+ start:57 stop:542 length:486 start_codon:yes stop_codon:yes gene_type:complete
MFPDEVFLTLCCPKAEITEAYSIGETAINIPADAPIPIEIELASTSLIGDLKDRLNVILGEMAGFSKGEIAELPRMTISTGRKTWLDMDTVKNLIVEVGCLSAIKYGTVKLTLNSCDLLEPPRQNIEEKIDTMRVENLNKTTEREVSRTRRTRPTQGTYRQ